MAVCSKYGCPKDRISINPGGYMTNYPGEQEYAPKGTMAQLATLTQRVKEAEDGLRSCLIAEQEQWGESAVLELTGWIKTFLSTPTSPDLVLVRREVLDKAIDFMENTAGTYWMEVCNQLKAAYNSTNKPADSPK